VIAAYLNTCNVHFSARHPRSALWSRRWTCISPNAT